MYPERQNITLNKKAKKVGLIARTRMGTLCEMKG